MTSQTCGVYALIDPRTHAIRYVGQSSDTHRRFGDHKTTAGRYPYPVSRWVNKIQRMGLPPVLQVLEVCSPEDLDMQERKWICILRESGVELLNCGEGGGSLRGWKRPYPMSMEQREKLRRANLGKPSPTKGKKWKHPSPLRGIPRTAEVKAKISASNRRRVRKPHVPSTRDAISAALKGRSKSPEHVKHNKEAQLRPEVQAKRKKSLSGRVRSPEHCAAISRAKRRPPV